MPVLTTTRRDGPPTITSVLRVSLNRPEVRNAFDEEVIAALTALAQGRRPGSDAARVVLSGEGPAFCAGADLGWMMKAVAYTPQDNLRDAEDLARMLELLDSLPVPLIGRVHGAALGGGVGLVAVCDIVVAADDAVFAFSEAKLGILPAVISPYVLAQDRRVGGARAVPDRRRGSTPRARASSGSSTASCPRPRSTTPSTATSREILTSAPTADRRGQGADQGDSWQPAGGSHRRDDEPHRRTARLGRGTGRDARVPREAQAELGPVAE